MVPSSSARASSGLHPDGIREALEAVLASPEFRGSDRLRRFLHYVVEEALSGRQARIKAYSVALAVFNRNEDFDSQNDPIVRIEAGRLRRALQHYYLTTGRDAPLVITMPKGGYVPEFALRDDGMEPRPPSSGQAPAPASHVIGSTGRGPTIAILPFLDMGCTRAGADYAAGITDELRSTLSRFRELRVLGAWATSVSGKCDAVTAGANYAVEGSVVAEIGHLRVDCRLLFLARNTVVWATRLEIPLTHKDRFAVPAELGIEIARAIGQPFGPIFSTESIKSSCESANPDPYLITLEFYNYVTNTSEPYHLAMREKLEDVVARYPDYALAWAMLSAIYTEESTLGFNRRDTNPLRAIEQAIACAREAVRLDPTNARAQQALVAALSYNGQSDEALAVIDLALQANPHDLGLLCQIGTTMLSIGRLNEARMYLEQGLALMPGYPTYFRDHLALTLYLAGELEAARIEIESSGQSTNGIHFALAAIIYADLGLEAEGKAALARFEHLMPDYMPNLWFEFARRSFPEHAQQRVVASLKRLGARIPPRGSSAAYKPAAGGMAP